MRHTYQETAAYEAEKKVGEIDTFE